MRLIGDRANGKGHQRCLFFAIGTIGHKDVATLTVNERVMLTYFFIKARGQAFLEAFGVAAVGGDDEVIAAMTADPNLIQRPIVEVGDRAVLARPIDKALELLK